MVRHLLPLCFADLLVLFTWRDYPHCRFLFHRLGQVFEVLHRGLHSLNRKIRTSYYSLCCYIAKSLQLMRPFNVLVLSIPPAPKALRDHQSTSALIDSGSL